MIADLEAWTGKPILLRAEVGLSGMARGAYIASDPDRSRHLIVYDPATTHLLNHVIPHELGHLAMHESAPPEARFVPVVTREDRFHARLALESELAQAQKMAPGSALAEVVDAWIDGTIAQVGSFPADIVIERDLWQQHPALRQAQREALEQTAREAHQGLAAAVREITPHTVFSAANSMNYALLRTVSRFLQQPWMVRPFRHTPYEDIGEELLASFENRSPQDLPGVTEVSALWAERLGISRWFRWIPADRIGPATKRLWQS